MLPHIKPPEYLCYLVDDSFLHTFKDLLQLLHSYSPMNARACIGRWGNEWRGASPPAGCQTHPPADRSSFLAPFPCAQSASPSPVPADAAPHKRAPADSEDEEPAGHARQHCCTNSTEIWEMRHHLIKSVGVWYNPNRLMQQGFIFFLSNKKQELHPVTSRDATG